MPVNLILKVSIALFCFVSSGTLITRYIVTDSSRDEGISIPKPNQPPRSNHDSALAKSLPMRVPTLSNYRTQDIDFEDDKVGFSASLLNLYFRA
jgi:hypothetical protein